MNELEQVLHTEGLVADYYALESQMLSTRTADAYKAVDKSNQAAVTVWVLRHPLEVNSPAVRRFLQRMWSLSHVLPPVCDMLAYGVDAAGVAFSVFPSLDGMPFLHGNIEAAEAERRFTSCLRFVDRLHAADIICGDLCPASFWVTRNGDLRFVGVMGAFDVEVADTAMLPPPDTIAYLSPEQRAGSGLEPATDVFALGVLGYRLFTRRQPYGDTASAPGHSLDPSMIPPASKLVKNAPVWLDTVFAKSLDPDPRLRYAGAGQVLAAITAQRQRAFDSEQAPAKVRSDGLVKVGQQEQGSGTIKMPAAAVADVPVEINAARKKVIIVLAVAIVAALGLLLAAMNGKSQKSAENSAVVANTGRTAQTEPGASSNALSLAEQTREIEKHVSSDDPLSHDILVKGAEEASSRESRELYEKAILDRARRLGLMRSAEQVRQWLRSIRQDSLPGNYSAVLKSLDTTLPVEALNVSLRRAYAVEPGMILKLAVALALDTSKLDEYQPLVSQLVGDAMKLEDAEKHSTIALILGSPDLAVVFGEDVIQRRNQIPDADLLWVLRILADRNDINVRSMASMAVERGVLPPLRARFLKLIRDRADLPSDVMQSLLRAAAGALQIDDVGSFGRWLDMEVEGILLAIMADSVDNAVRVEAFDILAGRNLTLEPSRSLLEWVRKNYWNKRADFAFAVGVLGNLDNVSPDAIAEVFRQLDRFVRDSDLIGLLLDTGHPLVVGTVITRYPELMNIGELLRLLENRDPGIRIGAIKALKSYNDIGALKIIIDHYEREKDETVKQAYRDNFWMIKQRQ